MKRSLWKSVPSWIRSSNRIGANTVRVFSARSRFDPYDEYRHPMSRHMWGEMQLETLHTQRRIDQVLYERVLREVEASWSRQPPALPEQGPTGTWYYSFSGRIYQRTWEDDQQVVLALEATDEVLAISLTVDESCVACLVENTEDRSRQIRLRHIGDDRETVFQLVEPLDSLEWGAIQPNGDHSLYVVGSDHLGRPYRVSVASVDPYQLSLPEPELLYQSNDPAEIVDVQRTKGCEFVAIQSMTKTSNEIYLSSGPSSVALVRQRQDNVQYHLDVGEHEDIVILHNNNGGEYSVVETTVPYLPLDPNQSMGHISPEPNDHAITDMDLFRNQLVLYESSKDTGCPRVTVHRRGSTEAETIPLTTTGSECVRLAPSGNVHFGADSMRFTLETPVDMPTIVELDLETKQVYTQPLSEDEQPRYKQKRIYVESNDGTLVPVSMFFKARDPWPKWSEKHRRSRPVVLSAYGAYGEPINLGYDPTLKPLLDRGFVVAFAHTRGGGDLGTGWYHAGRREHKEKAIEDFEACAKHLKSLWKGKMTAKAFSAGGVLVGAAVNRQPDLFDHVVLTNPFLDVYPTMMNPDLPLTPHEWEEFGNPLEDPKMERILQSYCPVTNVSARTNSYPSFLLVGTRDDEQVPFWNAVIFAKKVRDRMEDKDKIFLNVVDNGGHHLGSQRLQVAALELTFIIQNNQ